MLKLIYTVFLGILLALFVGVGVSVFYPAPEFPDAPDAVKYGSYDEWSDEQIAEQEAYDRSIEEYQENQEQPYNRNVSVVVTVLAIAFMAIGVTYSHKLDVLADGTLLGGIFTLLYGMGRGLASDDEIFRFLVITVGVVVALGLGYIKFARPNNITAKS